MVLTLPNARQSWTSWAMLTLLLTSTFWIVASGAGTSAARYIHPRAQIAGGVGLRVLPIGDSITWGAQSTHGNGYRGKLFDMLAERGNKVDFVGGMSTGTMDDNNHEGHRAFVIDQITNASTVGIQAAANIVLLHAGTNDMKNDVDPKNAPLRLKNLVDIILARSPEAVVLVCQIIPAGPDRYQDAFPRIDDFNAAIPGLVSEYVKAGKKMVMVSMNKALSTADLADNLHPKDSGYAKMADAYYAAIEVADEKGWISEPGKTDASQEEDVEEVEEVESISGRVDFISQYQLWIACMLLILPQI